MKMPNSFGKPRHRKIRGLSLNTMIPNILTLMALAAGLTSMRLAIQERWELAVFSIVAAAILDALDGRVARLLKGSSKFGAELDSLSDFVCFGVAPAMILYLWSMQDFGRSGWIIAMLFSMCCGLRLARFNVANEQDNAPPWMVNFFSGVPAPAGAGLVLLPMILSFQFSDWFFRAPYLVSMFLISVGGLMVSTLPTFSFKKIKITSKWILPSMLLVAGFAAFSFSLPWLTLSILLISYLFSIPFSYKSHKKFLLNTSS